MKRARKEGAAQARSSANARGAAGPVKGSFVKDSDSDGEPASVTGRFGRRRLNMAAGWRRSPAHDNTSATAQEMHLVL